MDGAHDMGGMQGFGPVNPEPEASEPLFHAPWERRAFAVTLAAGMLGQWPLDRARYARENQHPVRYLSSSYYEIWMTGLEKLLQESGLATADEIANGHSAAPAPAGLRVPGPADVPGIFAAGGPTSMDVAMTPRFRIGDRVRVANIHPATHTRAPRYMRGHTGIVHAYNGVHVFADRNAHGTREGQPLYNVRFDARELWGPDTTASAVHADLWEPHLEPA